ncbi:MAG: fatty acid desaturase, partial [Polyangiaceae bacterium]|nr:fatty acid desaturase [Polyangiaceae bacterium]
VWRLSRRLQIAGRGLIHFSVDPITWSLGVLSLWGHKQLEAIEIGHTSLHGTYDHLEGAEAFHSETFEWDFPVDEASWRSAHNIRHHQYTNVIGKDPDLRLGMARLSARIGHRWYHALQPASSIGTWITFGLAIHVHSTGMLDLYLHRDGVSENLADHEPETLRAAHRAAIGKLLRYYGREYVMFPALAGPFFPKVLLGNLAAELMRNIYTGATIYCGHVDATDYPEGTRARGRGAWYAMQVEAAHDFEVPLPLSILCGGLDYQIEHHLFPRLPPNRLREIAPRIRAACEEHGVTYRAGSWPETLWKSLRQLRKLASSEATPDTPVHAYA